MILIFKQHYKVTNKVLQVNRAVIPPILPMNRILNFWHTIAYVYEEHLKFHEIMFLCEVIETEKLFWIIQF